MYRYQRVEDGKPVGDIIYDTEERSEHVIRKTGAFPIKVVDQRPDNPEYYVKLAPTYEVGDLEIREVYHYEPHPNLKEIRRAEVNALREEKIIVLPYKEWRFDTDTDSRLNMLGKLSDIERTGVKEVNWITHDNTPVTLPVADFSEMVTSVPAHLEACVFAAFRHKSVIDNLNDTAAIIAYDISQGWPE